MNHTEWIDRLSVLFDGELSEVGRQEVEEHLKVCADCRDRYARWQKTSQIFFSKKAVPPASEFFVHRVMERIAEIEKEKTLRPARWGLALRWLAPALSVALMIFLALRPETSTPVSLDTFIVNSEGTADDAFELVMGG